MGQVGENRAAAALITLGAVVSLACVSMIGAVAALVVMAAEKAAPVAAQARDDTAAAGGAGLRRAVFRPLPAPREGECAVIIWNTGMIYCVRDKPAQAVPAKRSGSAVVVQAQAGD
ncbi:MAG TPA: hypothetical protein VKS43_01585 [Burkholderiales bacterium]|nr:hypothetical protein [Burkholderiales bacterium]